MMTNPVLEWCPGNVVGKAVQRGDLYPTKQRPEQKIDAAVTLMMAMGRDGKNHDAKGIEAFLANPIV
jgi:phage terminase large subunit-like protein